MGIDDQVLGRHGLVGFLGSLVKSTKTMIRKIDAVGPPNVKHVTSAIQASSSRGQAALLTLNKYPTKALNDAARQVPACAKLSG